MGVKINTDDAYIATDRESFRAQATRALVRFTPDDRERAASLETTHVTAGDVLELWQSKLSPALEKLDSLLENDTFRNYLSRQVGFDQSQAEAAAELLVSERHQQLFDEIIGGLYAKDQSEIDYQLAYAHDFLSSEAAELEDFYIRYENYQLALQAADKHGITLLDEHAGWLDRQRAAGQINKERQQIAGSEEHRLEEIDGEMSHLVSHKSPLVWPIVERDWDFMTVVDLRQKYQKKLDALTAPESSNPNTRLKLFEKTTSGFREHEAVRLAEARQATSLKAMQAINNEVYNLLLEIFDLDNSERNRLLINLQHYQQLSAERALILSVQRNRQQFLGQ